MSFRIWPALSGKPASIRTKPSSVSSRNTLTAPNEISKRPGIICLAGISSFSSRCLRESHQEIGHTLDDDFQDTLPHFNGSLGWVIGVAGTAGPGPVGLNSGAG